MNIYTGFGDKGNTSLFNGDEISKSSDLIHAYGTLDELNSLLGIINVITKHEAIIKYVNSLQNLIYVICTDLATPRKNLQKDIKRITNEDIKEIEDKIDFLTENLPELRFFIKPGGSLEASYFHLARTVCRRAERHLVEFINQYNQVNEKALILINRLSDFLFVLARYANFINKKEDEQYN